ncbi:hypothetical protein NA57DRAFT_54941 [Rhizodiscina lignyota]|uniref:ATPase inhibitor, mitochondrial n=1 Tax=Rhizodiscina lignyota TaxID=1504668 RepID=A0A9P4IKD4_9PEZI|nr:hypothetical protein NA57DRAFT_54941 [Rhizodiscina lignyota]
MASLRITRAFRPLTALSSRRLLSTTPRVMAAGDTGSGSSRPMGDRSGDAFTKREKGAEDYYVKQHEKEKLLAVRAKIAEAQKHLKDLEKHVDEISKEQGGEQH